MAGVGEFSRLVEPVRDDQTGELFLPASRRPDGTWRKPRRVKEGYVPQEEVPMYESKGRQLAKSKPAYPVGMSPAAIALQQNTSKDGKPTIPGLAPSAAKQVKKKKKKNNCQDEAVQEVSAKMVAFTIQEPDFGQPVKTKKGGTEPKTETPCPNAGVSASTDPAKKLKNLKKKLRDTEVLEEKIKKGELKNPDKDQLEKIKRKKDVLKEIQELEKQVN